MSRPKKPRQPSGRPKTYTDQTFLEVLTDKTQTTQQVRAALQQKEESKGIAYDTVLTALKKLADDEKIIRQEIPAGTGSGLLFLWSVKNGLL